MASTHLTRADVWYSESQEVGTLNRMLDFGFVLSHQQSDTMLMIRP